MRYHYLKSLVLLAAAYSAHSLTGVVRTVGEEPLEQVEVSFAHLDTVVYTDSTGAFTLDYSAAVRRGVSRDRRTLMSDGKEDLHLILSSRQNVSLSLHTLNGRAIHLHSGELPAGTHLLPLGEAGPRAAGLYLLRGRLGPHRVMERLVRGPGGRQRIMASTGGTTGVAKAAGLPSVDTVVFSLPGYATVLKELQDYSRDLGVIIMSRSLHSGSWYGFRPFDIDTSVPNFVNVLFLAYDSLGRGIQDLDTTRMRAMEDREAVTSESRLTVEKAVSFNYQIHTVILIDNSSSIGSDLAAIKEAAKAMVRERTQSQSLSVIAFSEEVLAMTPHSPPDEWPEPPPPGGLGDTNMLFRAIDDIPPGYASTNLYGALVEAFNRIDIAASVEDKYIQMGNVVLFTDGRDTQGARTLAQVKEARGDIPVFAVGLGDELDTEALRDIAGDFLYTTDQVGQVAGLFLSIQEQIAGIANSFYRAHYRSPKRGTVDHEFEILMDENSNPGSDSSIVGAFNSALFQAGWAPTANNVRISLDETRTKLVGSYEYEDLDGEVEGDTRLRWYKNGSLLSGEVGDTLLPANVMDGDSFAFEVTPVSKFGSPLGGLPVRVVYPFHAPLATALEIRLNGTRDTLLGSFVYGHMRVEEGQSILRWRFGGQPVGGGAALTVDALRSVSVDLADDTPIAFAVTPVADVGHVSTGQTVEKQERLFTFFRAPEVRSLSVRVGPSEDSLMCLYEYRDDDNDPEGATEIRWYHNGELVAEDVVAISARPFADGDSVVVEVRPIAQGGFWTSGSLYREQREVVVENWRETHTTRGDVRIHGFAGSMDRNVFVSAGRTRDEGDPVWDTYSVGIDSAGAISWMESSSSAIESAGWADIAADNSGFVLAGGSVPPHPDGYDMVVRKITTGGAVEWEKSYGGEGRQGAVSVAVHDDGYTLIGSETVPVSGAVDSIVIMRLDAVGDSLWTRKHPEEWLIEGGAVTGGYLIVEQRRITKLDEDADTLWSWRPKRKTYSGLLWYALAAVVEGPGGYYYVVGRDLLYGTDLGNPSRCYVAKLSRTGELLWEHWYGQVHEGTEFMDIATLSDGVLVTGRSDARSQDKGLTFVLKVYEDKREAWSGTVGGPADQPIGLTPVKDGFVTAGNSSSPVGAVGFYLKVWEDGTWAKRYRLR